MSSCNPFPGPEPLVIEPLPPMPESMNFAKHWDEFMARLIAAGIAREIAPTTTYSGDDLDRMVDTDKPAPIFTPSSR